MSKNFEKLSRPRRARAICQYCGQKSKAANTDHRNEPDIADMGRNWSVAYWSPLEVDGVLVSRTKHTCPVCNRMAMKRQMSTAARAEEARREARK